MLPIPATVKAWTAHDTQTLRVSSDVWALLGPHEPQQTWAVSVTLPALSYGDSRAPSSFLAHAVENTDSAAKTVECPTALLTEIYGDRCRIEEEEWQGQLQRVQQIALDEMVVAAMDSASYAYAQTDPEAVAELFQGNLLIRSGSVYHLDTWHYKVLMTSPVQQGYMRTTEETCFYVVDMSNALQKEDEEEEEEHPTSMDTSLGFLQVHAPHETAVPYEFTAKILSDPWPESHLFPVPESTQDTQSRIFVHVEYLAKCSVLSGDWILVAANDSTKSRLCRVYGVDGAEAGECVHLSPVLYFNLGLPLPPSTQQPIVTLTRLHQPMGPPVASAVTIARIASPCSMDKSLQVAFLDALKHWFEVKERIVCKNDILAIPLDQESTRLRPQGEEEVVVMSGGATNTLTTLAYFKVTRLEHTDTSTVHPAYYGHGRKIVPSVTQMIQTGVEQSRVPVGHLSRYYKFASPLPRERSTTPAYHQLQALVSSSLHPLGRDFELSCNVLLSGPKGGGKATLVREVVESLGIHVFDMAAYDCVSDTDAKTQVHLRSRFEKAIALAPCIVLLRGIEALARKSAVVESGQEPLLATVLQECIQNVNTAHTTSGYPVMVVATSSDVEALPTSILACFRHEVVMEAPDEKTRLRILNSLTHHCPMAPDISLKSIATQTAALVAKDLVDLVARTGVLALQRIYASIHTQDIKDITSQDIKAAGITLTAADFDTALSEARASYSDSIGAPKIPNVTWDDVGGLGNVKDDILDTIQLPLEHPELFGEGLKKRSGILLYGPPGTGKTLLAKAIATSCSLNFFSVKGPELLNMYIGESEANVRRVFQRARDAKPCVIFFDELDSVAPKRGEKGDSGGVMDRIVSQLLAELDGMSEGETGAGDVFVIGATNRPDLLDPALLRPGRFDKLLYLGVSDTHDAQLRIIQALTRKFRLHPELDLAHVAERCPFHYTGADFYALCSDAMLKAMTRVADTIEQKVRLLNEEKKEDLPEKMTAQYYLSHLATPEDIVVQVEEVDFIKALEELVPSVSATELAHYSKVREKFEQVKEEPKESTEQESTPPFPQKQNKGKGKQAA
ncbi:P-loop containing nucleoside triphosphate hydrolase protein [Spinellus fusiger]|nr:P-loop containing nucleoside triphosphate hydrolase protein [Spinellus fusiger]